jgi:hypothetical protein
MCATAGGAQNPLVPKCRRVPKYRHSYTWAQGSGFEKGCVLQAGTANYRNIGTYSRVQASKPMSQRLDHNTSSPDFLLVTATLSFDRPTGKIGNTSAGQVG